MNDNKLLISENPMQVLPQLAKLIGLNEAILLQQIHYWSNKSVNIIDGERWVYNSVSEWEKQFIFWSRSTIIRTIQSLLKQNLLKEGNFNKVKFDRTKWYTIQYQELNKMSNSNISDCTTPFTQNEQMEIVNMSKPIPETTHKTTREIAPHKKVEYLLNIPAEDIPQLRRNTSARELDVVNKGEQLYHWVLSKGKERVYRNFRSTLKNALLRDFPLKETEFKSFKKAKEAGQTW